MHVKKLFGREYVCVFEEDDARPPDMEHAHRAWQRLFGEPWDPKQATDLNDRGDVIEYLMPNGSVMSDSWIGNCGIYSPVETTSQNRDLFQAWRDQPKSSRDAVLNELSAIASSWADTDELPCRTDAHTLRLAIDILQKIT